MNLIKPIYIIAILILLLANLVTAAYQPGSHQLDATIELGGRLPSNSIIDIKPHNSSLWLSTGRGLTQLHLNAPIPGGWSVINESDGIGKGGISALVVNDTIIWAATAYSENTDQGWLSAGGGVGFSMDEGESWTWMPQPVDDRDETRYHPTTTHIQNVTYDLALSDSAVWITSYAGGLRKLPYGESEWELVVPDTISFWPSKFLNHRCFSVVFYEGNLFVGTAKGVNRSTDEGLSWTNSCHRLNDPSTLSGDFITALAIQETDWSYNLWAASWKAEGANEYYGVSVSSDNGATWRVALSDSTLLPNGEYVIDKYRSLKAHNFAFSGDIVYVAADKGLWISRDCGYTWGEGPLKTIHDPTIGDTLGNIDFFSVAPVGDSLWIGTDDGLSVGWWNTADSTFIRRIHRAHQPAGMGGEANTYAYPNPFSPLRGHTTRIQIPANGPTDVTYAIYNFAMEKVIEMGTVTLPGSGIGNMTGYGAVTWDGRDFQQKIVANGVYFYRVKVNDNTWWGKILVID
ncbi:MAG: hypothetical protein P9X24_14450 [Candidatus Hatepunaea meridiana]|nr:hypothetical protein [Candidatus Hatepunaea meridiana]